MCALNRSTIESITTGSATSSTTATSATTRSTTIGSTSWSAFLAAEAQRRSESHLERTLRPVGRDGVWLTTGDGRRLLDFSSNDYLGLASHPTVREASASAAARQAGATASRLVVGHDRVCEELESRLAQHHQTESALVFASGYLANIGVIAGLAGPGDGVFSDRLNHASIWDGIRLSGAKLYRYNHRDPDHLAHKLEQATLHGLRRKLIVTESVFSMDGDVAPLCDIAELKARHDAALVVDEAHADGIFGPRGEGYAHHLGVADQIDLHVGTFGKALGSYGAFVAGNADWIDRLRNTSRTFMFTTGLPPSVLAATIAALEIARSSHHLRERVHHNAGMLRMLLQENGIDTLDSTTQIVPVPVGSSERALAVSTALEQEGVLAVAIRPPTVPIGTARLRFSVSAAHEEEHLIAAVDALVAAW